MSENLILALVVGSTLPILALGFVVYAIIEAWRS